MRSALVFEAGHKIENRFLLSATAMRAARKLHAPATRMEDTVNNVFMEVAKGGRVIASLPEAAPPPTRAH
jgi:hypothetical protein